MKSEQIIKNPILTSEPPDEPVQIGWIDPCLLVLIKCLFTEIDRLEARIEHLEEQVEG